MVKVLGIVACIANIFFVTMHIITSETNMRVISLFCVRIFIPLGADQTKA